MIIISTGLGFPTSRILFAHLNPDTVTETTPKVDKKPLEMGAQAKGNTNWSLRKKVGEGIWKEDRNV